MASAISSCAHALAVSDFFNRNAPMACPRTLIGIPIPAGKLRFDLVYWPASLQNGLRLTSATIGLLIMALYGRWQWRRGRSEQNYLLQQQG